MCAKSHVLLEIFAKVQNANCAIPRQTLSKYYYEQHFHSSTRSAMISHRVIVRPKKRYNTGEKTPKSQINPILPPHRGRLSEFQSMFFQYNPPSNTYKVSSENTVDTDYADRVLEMHMSCICEETHEIESWSLSWQMASHQHLEKPETRIYQLCKKHRTASERLSGSHV